MKLLKQHWDLAVGLGVAAWVNFFWPFPAHFNEWLIVAIALAVGLIVAKLLSSLSLVLRVGVWLLTETFLRPNPWTIVGGVVGVVWCIDFATMRSADALSQRDLWLCAAIGYPLGAAVALVPRGVFHGFGSLKNLFVAQGRKLTRSGRKQQSESSSPS